jgi:hypothetical protein
MDKNTLEQFDLVTINTTKRVVWKSNLPNSNTNPYGIWSVVCVFSKTGMLLIQKDDVIAKIPVADITRIASYNIGNVFKKLEDINKKYLKGKDENG